MAGWNLNLLKFDHRNVRTFIGIASGSTWSYMQERDSSSALTTKVRRHPNFAKRFHITYNPTSAGRDRPMPLSFAQTPSVKCLDTETVLVTHTTKQMQHTPDGMYLCTPEQMGVRNGGGYFDGDPLSDEPGQLFLRRKKGRGCWSEDKAENGTSC